MLSNKFISHVQKGFKAETPGCLEHSFAMFEALLDAKHNQRQIVVAWLDLKNAYGSVRHNLICIIMVPCAADNPGADSRLLR